MFDITFNPGPSQISKATKKDIQDAVDQRILEISHRSPQFSEISTQAVIGLRKLLDIPEDYHIFYLDSASQAWHSILSNTVVKNSFHFINGAFSEKFYKAAQVLNKSPNHQTVSWGEQNDFETDIPVNTELITACYNETSTGVMMNAKQLEALRKNNPDPLITIDITSCAGAMNVDISQADCWYFSVQKCFGLPAGLGILIVSPKAYERSINLKNEEKNSAGIWQWEKLNKPMVEKNHQTPQTPNVLNIYLLAKQCERWNNSGGLDQIIQETKTKKQMIESWTQDSDFNFFVSSEDFRSDTVLTITGLPEKVAEIHEKCMQNNIVMGKGYGTTKANVFRIANFPAVTEEDLERFFSII